MVTPVTLPDYLRAAMKHPVECTCAACVELIDIGSNHRYDCECEVCARWWEAMGPEEIVE